MGSVWCCFAACLATRTTERPSRSSGRWPSAPSAPRRTATERSPDVLAACFAELGVAAEAVPSVETAVQRAMQLAGEEGAVICFGSLYLAGDVRTLLGKN